jgi:hypothetical protein
MAETSKGEVLEQSYHLEVYCNVPSMATNADTFPNPNPLYQYLEYTNGYRDRESKGLIEMRYGSMILDNAGTRPGRFLEIGESDKYGGE